MYGYIQRLKPTYWILLFPPHQNSADGDLQIDFHS